jgi:small-conductance mechanosensitive channel
MWLSGHNFIPPRQFLGRLIIFWAIFAAPSSLLAQMVPVPSNESTATAVEIPEDLTQDQVRDLIAHLSDDQVRELVIAQLDKLAAEQGQAGDPATYVSHLSDGFDVARVTLARAFNSNNEIYTLPKSIWQQMTGHGQISGWYILFQLIGLLVVGWIARLLTRRMLAKASTKSEGALPLGKRFDLACYGIFTGMLELGAFAVGAYLFIKITGQQTPMAQIFWYQVIWCLVLIKLVMLGVKQVVSLDSPDASLVSVSSNVAKQALAWTLILTTFLVLPRPLVNMVVDFGASVETELLLSIIFGGGFILLLIALMIHLRHYGTELIAAKDGKSGRIRMTFARNWWLLAIVYLLVIWFMAIGKRAATGESSLVPGLTSIILFLLIPYFDRGLQWLITRYFEDKEEEEEIPPADTAAEEIPPADTAGDEGIPSAGGSADVATAESVPAEAAAVEPTADANIEANTSNAAPAYAAAAMTAPTASTNTVTTVPADAAADIVATAQSNAPVYIATALRYARVLMVVLILGIFMRLWDIDIRAMSAQLLGPRFADALFDIGITVLLTWALWGVIRISIERQLDTGETPGEELEEAEAGGLGGTRVETVLPLIRIFIKITLIVMAVLISLSALGVNIGPLIAGAGVVGIAIGFGAQTLVRDIVSGFFYLIDDAFRIGEYVVIDQIRGTVEKISIRSFQLRHHNGPVHTIPYGEIRTLTNWSRDWAIMKCELRVPFETDIEKVRKMIKKIGIEMMEDPQWGPLLLAPVKSQGVNRMDDSALIVRFKFTAVPGQQYLIRREAFVRIQRAFEAEGIQFAPRRVLVEATTPQEAIKGAGAVLDQEEAGKTPPKDNM